MKKNKTKIFSFICALSMVFILPSCIVVIAGSNDRDSTKHNDNRKENKKYSLEVHKLSKVKEMSIK